MSEPRFDPALALKLDFDQGQVTLRGQGPCLVVPKGALLDLLSNAGEEATSNFGQQLGVEVGRRMMEKLGSSIEAASIECFVEHLGGELALLGLGTLAIERWGKALVLVIEGAPAGTTGAALVSAVIAGALQRSLSRDTAVIELMKGDNTLRLLVVSSSAGAEVKQWLAEEVPWGSVLTRLHAPRGNAS
jgi:hypothetical protein